VSVEKVTLAGPRVRLEPLGEEHLPGLVTRNGKTLAVLLNTR